MALDMSGNVIERTRSLWGDEWSQPAFKYPYDPNDPRREDLAALESVHRVVRGGAFGNLKRSVRAPCRGRIQPGNCFEGIGFRVAVSRSAPSPSA
jgi:formylglycine-generating enzyme required for sulfatase activity